MNWLVDQYLAAYLPCCAVLGQIALHDLDMHIHEGVTQSLQQQYTRNTPHSPQHSWARSRIPPQAVQSCHTAQQPIHSHTITTSSHLHTEREMHSRTNLVERQLDSDLCDVFSLLSYAQQHSMHDAGPVIHSFHSPRVCAELLSQCLCACATQRKPVIG
jgi:hypothetical protein